MRRSATVLLLLIPALSRTSMSQRGAPVVSLTAGVGQPFGGIGVQGEVLTADGRLGILGGAGIMPGIHYLRSPIAGAASVRYYFTRQEHRLFLNASWSLVRSYDLLLSGVPTVFEYGPGISVGYSYLSKIGFTFTIGAGVGRARFETVSIGQLGLGWTWRRSLRSERPGRSLTK
jgi:hypothetical protein